MDRIEAMQIFLKVVDKQGFTAASRELRMALATVSRKVAELEGHLGARLLHRTTRKIALTDAGQAYAVSARRILAELDEAERTAAGELRVPRGELVLTAPVLFGRLHILPVVTAFLAAYPAIDVQLVLSDRNLDLVDDHIDLAVRIGALPDSSMVALRVGATRTVVCASPTLLATHGVPKDPQQLATMPCISFAAPSRAAPWMFRRKGARRPTAVTVRPRLSVSTAEAAVWAATQGVGFTRVLHYQCSEAVHTGALRIVLTKFEMDPLPIHLLHAGGGALPTKTRVFLDFAAARLRRQLR